MIDIKLADNQSGYDAIREYIFRYWEHNIYDTVIVSMGLSYDGKNYRLIKEIACPYKVDYLFDWWEGEKYIKLFGIKTISEVDVSGGIYIE